MCTLHVYLAHFVTQFLRLAKVYAHWLFEENREVYEKLRPQDSTESKVDRAGALTLNHPYISHPSPLTTTSHHLHTHRLRAYKL